MQYLSKAYSYYSGINPATLSGAIDVIVVRQVDSEGNVTLSSSPFHVRFGKLQVLRAGEKRVTLRLPNNLAAPHVAPFSMKVGESGEAFFVVETDEQVPEELLTSPVVMPTETELPPSSPPSTPPKGLSSSSTEAPGPSLTHEPFGETERQVGRVEPLGDVDFLDLDAPSPHTQHERHSPSKSLLRSASSLLPSMPPLSSPPLNDNAKTHTDPSPPSVSAGSSSPPPNPMSASPGEPADLPGRDRKLSDVEASDAASPDDLLPKVEANRGEGPGVLYGRDVVLDMAGYHSASAKTNADSPSDGDATLEMFIQDLLASSQSHSNSRPHLPASRATDPDLSACADPETPSTPSPGPAALRSEPDLPAAFASMSLSPTSIARRFDRGQSEPPQDMQLESTHEWQDRRHSVDLDDILKPGKLRNVEENPYMFILDTNHQSHVFELALCDQPDENSFPSNRITFQSFIEDPNVVNDTRLVVHYNQCYHSWTTAYRLLYALALYRRQLLPPGQTEPSLPSLADLGTDLNSPPRPAPGSGWSRWWRRGQTVDDLPRAKEPEVTVISTPVPGPDGSKQYAKTLRLSSDQLKQLNLKSGPNTVQFSVTSSYSGLATCTSRIFLWEETDQVVISDIDGTITKSDALGHVFAAIGRDWTHLGIAKLYTDICNNGYKILYLTSRAIGQADTTREYLRSIVQGEYRLPEGPVIMSPDRLMASLHREVIMRKPEVFKMACLRDIQRLFGTQAKEAFFAGFGNRITDAMSYRSVGIEAAKIYTIDSTGVVKTELLQAAGHKGSYIQLNDLVNEVFPPVSTKFIPEFTDFNYWRSDIPDIPLPDFTPPSPALSARSDTSGRLSVLGKITGLGRRSSKQTLLPATTATTTTDLISRPSSPLIAPSINSDELSDVEDDVGSQTSMPVGFDDEQSLANANDMETGHDDSFDDDALFDDDILAAGEMKHVPF